MFNPLFTAFRYKKIVFYHWLKLIVLVVLFCSTLGNMIFEGKADTILGFCAICDITKCWSRQNDGLLENFGEGKYAVMLYV